MSIQFQSRDRRSIHKSYYRREDKEAAGQSGVVAGRWRSKPIGRGFAPRQCLSFSHVDVGDAFQFINHIMAERRRNTAGRSGVGERRWRFNLSRRFNLSIIYRRFASSQRFVFFIRSAFAFNRRLNLICRRRVQMIFILSCLYD